MREIFKGPSLIYHIVKKLKEKYPDRRIGKTKLQKLLYLLEVNSDLDLHYTLYYYGPYSSKVGRYINEANSLDFIKVVWEQDIGYSINPATPNQQFLYNLSDLTQEDVVNKVIEKYGEFTANELSIITTGIYLQKRFGINDPDKLIDSILKVKPKNRKEWIEEVLKKGGVI